MLESKLIETGVYGRARCLIDRSVALGEGHDSRQLIDERQDLPEPPDTAAVQVTLRGAACIKGRLYFVGSSA